MRIKFSCPHCDRVIRVPPELAGKQGRCPGCTRGLEVPTESTLQSHQRDVERMESQRRASAGELDQLGRLSDMDEVIVAAKPSGSGSGDGWETAKVAPPSEETRPCPECRTPVPFSQELCPHCGANALPKRPPWQVTVALFCVICMPLPGLVFAQFGLMAARKKQHHVNLAWVAVGLNAFHLVSELLYFLVVGLRS